MKLFWKRTIVWLVVCYLGKNSKGTQIVCYLTYSAISHHLQTFSFHQSVWSHHNANTILPTRIISKRQPNINIGGLCGIINKADEGNRWTIFSVESYFAYSWWTNTKFDRMITTTKRIRKITQTYCKTNQIRIKNWNSVRKDIKCLIFVCSKLYVKCFLFIRFSNNQQRYLWNNNSSFLLLTATKDKAVMLEST